MARRIIRNAIRNAIQLDALPASLTTAGHRADAKPTTRKRTSKPKEPKVTRVTPERYRLLPGETSDQRAARLRAEFYADLRANGFAPWTPEHKFALATLGRKWAMDLAWEEARIAVEIEGRGAHQRGRYWTDLEKYNRAAAMGWLLVRVSYEMIADGRALALVRDVFAYRRAQSA